MFILIPIVYTTAVATLFITSVYGQYDQALVGTWTTKSKSVITGPGFYDPVADKLIEPALTGISYSFTADGWYEEAYYRAISNPQQPACPSGIMQWQHGRYSLPGNGSIVLEPIAVDGRQLTSYPCSYESSLYVRYSQSELMSKYQVGKDGFHNVQRLDMYMFDGSPMHPMFLVAQPPQMLPTQTLNPTAAATGASSTETSSPAKRDVERQRVIGSVRLTSDSEIVHAADPKDGDKWFWAGIAMISIGTVMYVATAS